MKNLNTFFLLASLTTAIGLLRTERVFAQANFTILQNFGGVSSGLLISGDRLYGPVGNNLFQVNIDGSGLGNLHNFGPDWMGPTGAMGLSESILYGTTEMGGTFGYGTVYAVNNDGTGFKTLHNFSGSASDQGFPFGLMISSNTLYGVVLASWGGIPGVGLIWAVESDGTAFRVIHTFTGPDGAYPKRSVIQYQNTLYGTTPYGGGLGQGSFTQLTKMVPSSEYCTASRAVMMERSRGED